MKVFHTRSVSTVADLQAMSALVRRFAADNLHVIDLPYRFSSWALDELENTRLWFTPEGDLAAWAVMQSPWWMVDYALHPAAGGELLPEILYWADDRARRILPTPYGRSCWFVAVFSDHADRIRDLENAGYTCQADVGEDSWSKVLLSRTTSEPVRHYAPPPGFRVRPLAGEAEVEKFVALQQAVFESRNMTLEWRLRTLRQPAYRPELDLVVEAPGGGLAAFCLCWLEQQPGEPLRGQVEPLGCLKEYRQKALGRVALSEGLRRLQECGAQEIYVETDDYRDTAFRLYQSFGFQVIRKALILRKDFPAG